MQASPDGKPLLIVSASGRALAASASKRRIPVVVLDLFNDSDTRSFAVASRACAGRHYRLDARKLVAAADELCPPHACAGFVYGSAIEGRPRLIERLARGRTLFGNPPETVALVKDPLRLFPLLDELGIPYPHVSIEPPRDPENWLVKRTGGGGGTHVRRASSRHRRQRNRYFQTFQPGRTLSVLFAADGVRARVIGFNEQWAAAARKARPFAYGGAVSRPTLPSDVEAQVTGFVERLVGATGLRGVNGIDFVLDATAPFVLEVNPRPTATIDLYDADVEGGMLAAHIRACGGDFAQSPVTSTARAHAIVYAATRIRIPGGMRWPDWCTDLPESGSVIPAGAPVCSVHAAAENAVSARERVFARKREIEATQWEKAA